MHGASMPMLPVVDSRGRCLGVLTTWDVVSATALGHDLHSMRAADVVADDIAVSPDMDPEQAMRGAGRLVPVVENGAYVGALTRADLQAAKRLEELLGPAAGLVERAVSAGDTMHGGIHGHYLLAGIVAAEWVRTGVELAGNRQPGVIVDLPCGHGRVMRVLRAAYPDARLIACDVDREGVDFCARIFGAEPVYSSADPEQVPLRPEADLIWVGSLLTHLPPARWPAFLELFGRALRPGGVLVVTTLGRPRLLVLASMSIADPDEMLRERDEAGHSFRPYEGEQDYGLTLTLPEWVRDTLAETEFELLRHAPKGWFPPGPGQDVWICRRPAG